MHPARVASRGGEFGVDLGQTLFGLGDAEFDGLKLAKFLERQLIGPRLNGGRDRGRRCRRVGRLELSAITDVHGNRIDFEYIRAPGSTAPLLAAITYNDGRAAVRLDYEERPDIVRTRAPGFPVELRHRLHALVTEVDGAPVRTTTLTYARSVKTPASVLARIDTVAADGTALAPWHLDYTRASNEPRALEIAHAPALDPTADGRAWLDLDGDALPACRSEPAP